MADKINKYALATAVRKLAKFRVEDVGGRKERPAETVQSCLNRGYAGLGSTEGISYILRHGVKYYLEADPVIAAAPELVEALKAAIPCIEGYIDHYDYSKGNEVLATVRAALSKAGVS